MPKARPSPRPRLPPRVCGRGEAPELELPLHLSSRVLIQVPDSVSRERSRLPEDVLAECRELVAEGYKDITLLGQNVNSYGKDLGLSMDFADLLEQINAIPGDFLIRFMTSHPKDASQKLFEVMGRCEKIAPVFHLPVQAGNDRVLKAMNRHYDRETYLDKKEPIHFRKLRIEDLSGAVKSQFDTKVVVEYTDHGEAKSFEAVGNGPIDAVQRGLNHQLGLSVKVLDYEEHALQSGANSQAAAYIHLLDGESGRVTYGVGVSSNITRASVRAIFSAVNRLGLEKH